MNREDWLSAYGVNSKEVKDYINSFVDDSHLFNYIHVLRNGKLVLKKVKTITTIGSLYPGPNYIK